MTETAITQDRAATLENKLAQWQREREEIKKELQKANDTHRRVQLTNGNEYSVALRLGHCQRIERGGQAEA